MWKLILGAIQISENYLPLELGHSDVILGIEWLSKLSNISTNWKTPLMQFMWNGSKVILRGDPKLERSMVTLKSMMKVIKKSKGGILVELTSMQGEVLEAAKGGSTQVLEILQFVLQQYQQLFRCPRDYHHYDPTSIISC